MKKICTFAVVLLSIVSLLCSCGGGEAEISLVDRDPDNLAFSYEHQIVKLFIDSNRSWKASCSAGWLELGEKRGGAGSGQPLTFTLSENTDKSRRQAEVVVTSAGRQLVLNISQSPRTRYCLNERFDFHEEMLEEELPSGWFSVDKDKDSWGWRCCRDTETGRTYAYSASYYDAIGRVFAPDNYLVSPSFTLPDKGFNLRWDSATYDVEYPGDRYQVYIASYPDGEPVQLLFEGATGASAEPESHLVALDDWVGYGRMRIAFRHYDSRGLGRVLITNVEVSNR